MMYTEDTGSELSSMSLRDDTNSTLKHPEIKSLNLLLWDVTTKNTSGLRVEFKYALRTASTVYHSYIPFASSKKSNTFRQVAREVSLQTQSFPIMTPYLQTKFKVPLLSNHNIWIIKFSKFEDLPKMRYNLLVISSFDLQHTKVQEFHNINLIQHCLLILLLLLRLLLKALLLQRSFGLLNEFFPFGTVSDAVLPIFYFHFCYITFYIILPSIFRSS